MKKCAGEDFKVRWKKRTSYSSSNIMQEIVPQTRAHTLTHIVVGKIAKHCQYIIEFLDKRKKAL